MLFRRVRGDPAPDSERAVLYVALSLTPSEHAVQAAIGLADGGPVAVLGLLKIHGYALGMPNPGLLPTAKEKTVQRDLVAGVIARFEARGCEVDGQVAATRSPVKTIATVARTRRVHHVVIDQAPVGRVRRSLEGDVVAAVRRRLRSRAEVIVPGPG